MSDSLVPIEDWESHMLRKCFISRLPQDPNLELFDMTLSKLFTLQFT